MPHFQGWSPGRGEQLRQTDRHYVNLYIDCSGYLMDIISKEAASVLTKTLLPSVLVKLW